MTGVLSHLFLSSSSRKALTYYIGYCCLFLFSYLSLVSTISFFHFLLDHEMSVIESWLSHNAWEVLILSKAIAAFIVLKSLKLNNYFLKGSLDLIKEGRFLPTRSALVLVLFLMVFFLALVYQLKGGLDLNPKASLSESSFIATSFFGSILFFMIDIFVIYSAIANFPIVRRRQVWFLGVALPTLFLVCAKIAIPYLDGKALFLILHFYSLLILVSTSKGNFANLILYSLAIAGPLSAFFGTDLVWGDTFSSFTYPDKIPSLGILAIWFTGLLYYIKRV